MHAPWPLLENTGVKDTLKPLKRGLPLPCRGAPQARMAGAEGATEEQAYAQQAAWQAAAAQRAQQEYAEAQRAWAAQVRETGLQRLRPPYHDEQTRANQTQAGRQQLERRGQREKENRQQGRRRKRTERLKEQKARGKRGTRAKVSMLMHPRVGRSATYPASDAIAPCPLEPVTLPEP